MTYQLDDSSHDLVQRKHHIRLGPKHDPQRLFICRRVNFGAKELFRHVEQVPIVALGRIVTRLHAHVLLVGFGEAESESDGVDGSLEGGGFGGGGLFAVEKAAVENLYGQLYIVTRLCDR
jgi:hypothetical protein